MAKYGLRRITTVPVLLFILLGGLAAGLYAAPSGPEVRSALALVVDRHTGQRLYAKNPRTLAPIASITKLMSAMVVLDSAIALDKRLVITAQDVDLERGSHSRLRLGSSLTVREALQVALMSSENRAASALARAYPGGTAAFVAAMNRKARSLGMQDTRFVDSTGLSSDNTSTAEDLVLMVEAASGYALISEMTTRAAYLLGGRDRAPGLPYRNTNVLVRNDGWSIGFSKTGYIKESGRCLVMSARIAGRPLAIVLLGAQGKLTPVGDANRIRRWVERQAGSVSSGQHGSGGGVLVHAH